MLTAHDDQHLQLIDILQRKDGQVAPAHPELVVRYKAAWIHQRQCHVGDVVPKRDVTICMARFPLNCRRGPGRLTPAAVEAVTREIIVNRICTVAAFLAAVRARAGGGPSLLTLALRQRLENSVPTLAIGTLLQAPSPTVAV